MNKLTLVSVAMALAILLWFVFRPTDVPPQSIYKEQALSEASADKEAKIDSVSPPTIPLSSSAISVPAGDSTMPSNDAKQSGPIKTEIMEPAAKPVADQFGILRDSQGNLLKMRQRAAMQACAQLGMQLPTIRELVAWGGKLVEKGGENELELPSGYSLELVSAVNPDGKKDEFNVLYNSVGGSFRPVGDLMGHFLLSASVTSENSSEFYSFENTSGYVSTGPENYPIPGAVRCAPKPKSKP